MKQFLLRRNVVTSKIYSTLSLIQRINFSTNQNLKVKKNVTKVDTTSLKKVKINYSSHHQRHFQLIESATTGDITALEELSKLPEMDLNYADYDKRTALHLAASEGDLIICQYLVSQGVEINKVDRNGYTPLEAALKGKHDEVIHYLHQNGGVVNVEKQDHLGSLLLEASSSGSIDDIRRLIKVGTDINITDYDKRSPLHLASSAGKVQCVEFLILNGANVNAVDRFGNNPLVDAQRTVDRNHQTIVKILKEHGVSSPKESQYQGVHLATSIRQSFAPLLELSQYCYCESWTSSGQDFVLDDNSIFSDSSYGSTLAELSECPTGKLLSKNGDSPFGKCWLEKKAQVITEINKKTLPGRVSIAKNVGLSSFIVIPIIHENSVHGLLAFYNHKSRPSPDTSQSSLSKLTKFTSRIVAAGVYGNTKKAVFDPHPDIPEGQQAEVYEQILAREIFNPNMLYAEVNSFYSMGMDSYYFHRFTTKILSNHITAFISGRKFAATTKGEEEMWVQIENKSEFLGGGEPEQALFMVSAKHKNILAVERRIQSRMSKVPLNKSCSLEYFESQNPLVHGGTEHLGIFVLITGHFAAPNLDTIQDSTSIWDLASSLFLSDKSKDVRYQYQEIVRAAKVKLAPVVRVFDPIKDGMIPVRIGFQGRTCYFMQLTQLLAQNNVWPHRKFVETFANGVTVYSIYVEPSVEIDEILSQFTRLFQIPSTSCLVPFFLEGKIKAETITYTNAVGRFIYYFLNQTCNQFIALTQSLEGNPTNLAKLRTLQSSMKREAVSQARIMEICASHPSLIEELMGDFKKRTTTNWAKDGAVPENKWLCDQIERFAQSQIEKEVLMALYNFNTSVVKTNMFKKSKAALSFRIDMSKFSTDWPSLPYGLFFVLGAEFQGFHIRFSDVARGGIRLIQSRNEAHYNQNLSTLLAENYGLAFTQNMKNKDIPEFGSKGTILLRMDKSSQKNGFLSFKKYIAGLLDLLIPHDEIQDNFGKPEVLFLGPDEGTADMMEWAALYAKSRGYPYWRAFTTGKPPSLGGIPHDTYGMTTRSVHRYVLGCLREIGLEESEATKIQTGGPDGDLGSNEITISKDKTKAIIDGAGVVYDPEGLNRRELTRLAHNRLMIDHFDDSKLGSSGFKVLLNDANVTLPDGTLVDSGLAFRNNFHLNPLCTADLFVPCGGRPESVNLSNVKQFLNDDGSPRFKIICEGANLFFTNDARCILEKAGIILYKDASSNKGGVTSSSLEVLVALALSEKDFKKHMTITDTNKPDFYMNYCEEIQNRIEADADLEFECVWREHEATGTHRHVLTEQVSNKINELNLQVSNSNLWDNKRIRDAILTDAIPKTLTNFMSLEDIYRSTPESYLKAIFACYVASRYVYRFGVNASEFSFFDFMRAYFSRK